MVESENHRSTLCVSTTMVKAQQIGGVILPLFLGKVHLLLLYVVSLSFLTSSSQTIYVSTIIFQSPNLTPSQYGWGLPLKTVLLLWAPLSLPSRVSPALHSFSPNPQPQPKPRAPRRKAKLINFLFLI